MNWGVSLIDVIDACKYDCIVGKIAKDINGESCTNLVRSLPVDSAVEN